MPQATPLIATIAAAFVLALVFGFLGARIRVPPLMGYLLAGVLIGVHTPGFVADVGLARQLADIGVMSCRARVAHRSIRNSAISPGNDMSTHLEH